jgi:hypothetical protein
MTKSSSSEYLDEVDDDTSTTPVVIDVEQLSYYCSLPFFLVQI